MISPYLYLTSSDHLRYCFVAQSENRIRGEFTVVLGPYDVRARSAADQDSAITAMLLQLQSDGIPRSEAVKVTVDALKLPKSVIYKAALNITAW